MGQRLPWCEPLSARRSTSSGEWPQSVTNLGDGCRSAATNCASRTTTRSAFGTLRNRPWMASTRVVCPRYRATASAVRGARPAAYPGRVTSEEPRPAGPPPQVRLAGVLVGVEAMVAIGFAVVLIVGALSAEIPGNLFG